MQVLRYKNGQKYDGALAHALQRVAACVPPWDGSFACSDQRARSKGWRQGGTEIHTTSARLCAAHWDWFEEADLGDTTQRTATALMYLAGGSHRQKACLR